MTSTATAFAPGTTPGAAGGGQGTPGGPPPHRVLRFVESLHSALDRLEDPATWAMTEDEQAEALALLHTASSRMAALELSVLSAADRNDLGRHRGASSAAAWLADATTRAPSDCHRATRLARALDSDFTATAAALAAGECDPEQAWVVVQAVRRLQSDHDDLPPGTHAAAEAHLLGLARSFDAPTLRRMGKRLFEVVCPEAADAEEGRRLGEEEAKARRTSFLTMRDNGDGTVDGRFRLPSLHAQLLRKALQTLTSPQRLGDHRLDPRTGQPLDSATLAGHGLIDLLENHLDLASMPHQRKSPFTLVVTIGIDALVSGLGVAILDTGGRISAGEARRLACRAGLIPMVLGGDSVPLDLGREQRLFTHYQHLALAQQYGGCAAAGCDRPPSWAEIHHPHPWRDGGSTDVANGLPLCPPHHHMADHPGQWDMRRLASGKVRFSRRQ